MLQATKFNISASTLEAADIYSNQGLNQCTTRGVPQGLLAGYPMQWALDCSLVIVNRQESIHVNAFKLASQSQLFKTLLRLSSGYGEQQQTSLVSSATEISRVPKLIDKLLVHVNDQSCLSDLILTIHLCHIDNCRIGGILHVVHGDAAVLQDEMLSTQTGVSRTRSDQSNIIHHTDECIILPFSSYCSLTCALRVANIFQLNGLQQQCYNYIGQTINTQTCWSLWKAVVLSTNHDQLCFSGVKVIDHVAADLVLDYIFANFAQIIQAPDSSHEFSYLDLSVNEFELILSSDRLNVKKESTVVHAVQRWLGATARCNDTVLHIDVLPRLLSNCVRLAQLKLSDIELVYSFPGLRQAIQKADRMKRSQIMTSSSLTGQRMDWFKPYQRTNVSQAAYLSAFRQARRRLFRSSRNLRPLVPTVKTGDNLRDTDVLAAPPTPSVERGNEGSHDTEVMDGPEETNRETRVPHEAIFVFGGWLNGKPCQDICVFDSRGRKWLTYGPQSDTLSNRSMLASSSDNNVTDRMVLPHALMSFGITLVKDRYIYIAGGELPTANNATSTVMRYDLNTGSNISSHIKSTGRKYGSGWKMCPPMHERRRDLALVNLDNKLVYAIGGDSNQAVLNSMEQFSLDETDWSTGRGWSAAANMLIARGAPAADSLNGLVYVCGGYTESQMDALTNSCEVYSPAVNQWTFIQPMAQPRYYSYAVAVQGVLFVLGGGGDGFYHGAGRMITNAGYSSTVERYDPESNIWEFMPPTSERADFAACLFEEELVCLGGGGETFCTDEVQRWQPWTTSTAPGNITETAANTGTRNLSPFSTSSYHDNDRSTRPIWLTRDTDIDDESISSGWKKYVRLPHPLWGHRCVVVKGVDKIIPYLNCVNINETKALEVRYVTTCNYDQQKNQYVLHLSHDVVTDGSNPSKICYEPTTLTC